MTPERGVMRRSVRNGRGSWVRLSVVDEAELVPLRIGHGPPGVAVLPEVGLGPSPAPAQRLDARRGSVHVVDQEIEVHPIPHGLRLRHALKGHVRRIRGLGGQIHELRGRPEPAMDLDAENRGPKHRETLGVRAIDLDPADASDRFHGCSPTNSSPAVSAKPSATFIACTPFPAAPFMRLSIAHRATMRSPRGSTAKPTSAKVVPASSFGSGEGDLPGRSLT